MFQSGLWPLFEDFRWVTTGGTPVLSDARCSPTASALSSSTAMFGLTWVAGCTGGTGSERNPQRNGLVHIGRRALSARREATWETAIGESWRSS